MINDKKKNRDHVKTAPLRCLNASDEACKYPECNCTATSHSGIVLHRVASVGGCGTNECNEGRDCPSSEPRSDKNYAFFIAFGTLAAVVIGIGCAVAKLAGWI